MVEFVLCAYYKRNFDYELPIIHVITLFNYVSMHWRAKNMLGIMCFPHILSVLNLSIIHPLTIVVGLIRARVTVENARRVWTT